MIGRPALFNTKEELQDKIDDYFLNGVKIKTIVVGKPPQSIEIQVPTITGLANYLGFESRQSFYDYESKSEFSYTIKRARLSIEQNYEELLQSSNPTGAIFALKNFGWKDKQEIEQSGSVSHHIFNGIEIVEPKEVPPQPK